jgi:ribosomal protein S27E
MIETLKKICEANTEKSTIVLKGKCSDCGCETIIEITPTSGGFGLQGGALFKYSPDYYLVKCHDCYQVNPIIHDIYKPQNTNVPLLDKVSEEGPDSVLE